MKTTLYKSDGSKKSEITMPEQFSTKVRPDIVAKYFEADKFIQPYSSDPEAGKKVSASGKIGHRRHKWKSHYGRGIARLPRKTMWRRGTNFFWVGAFVPGTKGGRRAHPPKGIGKEKKINKKEIIMAMNSALASTAHKNFILDRYATLHDLNSAPFVIESLPEKTKSFLETLKKVFGLAFPLVLKKKTVRPGKGKLRGRKYKSNAGLLLIKGKEEKAKFTGIDIRTSEDLTISDLYPLGRLTLYTKKALEDLEAEENQK